MPSRTHTHTLPCCPNAPLLARLACATIDVPRTGATHFTPPPPAPPQAARVAREAAAGMGGRWPARMSAASRSDACAGPKRLRISAWVRLACAAALTGERGERARWGRVDVLPPMEATVAWCVCVCACAALSPARTRNKRASLRTRQRVCDRALLLALFVLARAKNMLGRAVCALSSQVAAPQNLDRALGILPLCLCSISPACS